MSALSDSQVHAFAALFAGRTDAYGTGKGEWIRRRLALSTYRLHLEGKGPGLGIAPLRDDGTVSFAAIDLDEPNFEAAIELANFLSFGTAWIERSRSGNAHVWAFFKEPIEAWIPRGIMKEAIAATGKPTVEIFPKQDMLYYEGMVGNYINLPYHGPERPVLDAFKLAGLEHEQRPLSLEQFLVGAEAHLNAPTVWRKRAEWLMITPPDQRRTETVEFGTGKELHMCAEYIVANRDENPIAEGHRNVVYFNLAKMLLHYEGFGNAEAWELLTMVRDSSDEKGVDHVSDSELLRIFNNAKRGQFTSTGCDDPLMSPYVSPDCPIAHAELRR